MAKATGPVYRVPFRRRRDALTNYAKRLALVKSGKPRLVVRKSLKNVIVQFVKFAEKGDEVIAAANSMELKKYGWNPRSNLPTAYLTGALAAKRAAEKGISEFVLDIGLQTASKNSLPFSAASGAIDAGLKSGFKRDSVDDARIRGEHIAKYAESLKSAGKYEKVFSSYLKDGVRPEDLPEKFDAVKAQILKGGA